MKNKQNTKKRNKTIMIVSLILCVLICASPVTFSTSAHENNDGKTVEIKDAPTPLAAGTSQDTKPGDTNTATAVQTAPVPAAGEFAPSSAIVAMGDTQVPLSQPASSEDDGNAAIGTAQDVPVVTPDQPSALPDEPVVTPGNPIVNPDTPPIGSDQPAVDPDAPIVDPDQPAVDPEKPAVDPEPSGTNTEITLAYAQRIIDGYDACATDKERQEYFGITNNNFSNDTFRSKLHELMGNPLPLESDVTAQSAYCNNLSLYLHVYFVKDGSTRVPVVYAATTGTYNGSGRWDAWMVYFNGAWYESQKTHAYNGSHQPTSISSFNGMDVSGVQAMVSDPAHFLPLGTLPDESEEQEPQAEPMMTMAALEPEETAALAEETVTKDTPDLPRPEALSVEQPAQQRGQQSVEQAASDAQTQAQQKAE